VREAVFNALGSMGLIDGANVVDLFAGSGAMGIEALSRGAAHATFVDTAASSVALVRTNLAATDLLGAATVVRADALAWLATAAPVDVVIADPPYSFGDWAELFTRVVSDLVVVESDRLVELPEGWGALRDRRYGATWVRLVRRTSPTGLRELP